MTACSQPIAYDIMVHCTAFGDPAATATAPTDAVTFHPWKVVECQLTLYMAVAHRRFWLIRSDTTDAKLCKGNPTMLK